MAPCLRVAQAEAVQGFREHLVQEREGVEDFALRLSTIVSELHALGRWHNGAHGSAKIYVRGVVEIRPDGMLRRDAPGPQGHIHRGIVNGSLGSRGVARSGLRWLLTEEEWRSREVS